MAQQVGVHSLLQAANSPVTGHRFITDSPLRQQGMLPPCSICAARLKTFAPGDSLDLNMAFLFRVETMKIADLQPNNTVDEIVLTIIEKKEPREVQKRFGGTARLAELVGRDDDGDTVQVTLWNDEIGDIQEDDVVKIVDGWVKKWDNELQVSTGRNGRIEKVA
jgi:replication factor A1